MQVNRFLSSISATLFVVALSAANLSASLSPITTLYGTGVSNTGAVLPGLSVDSHYTLVSAPAGSPAGGTGAGSVLVEQTGQFPFGYWFADTSTAAWDSQSPATGFLNGSQPAGLYDYQTTFDLTGFNANTAAINGIWAADNEGVAIYINGINTNQPGMPYGAYANFNSPTAFTINSGFVSGVNTIDFIVNNDPQSSGNPTGLFVDMSGVANQALTSANTPTPEPAFYGVLGAGLCGLFGFVRRRRNA